jgi:hypothetical protein
LAALGAAAAGAAGSQASAAVPLTGPRDTEAGGLLVSRVRDAMLGLAPAPSRVPAGLVRAGLDGALAEFRDSRYARLSVALPRLISAGHVLAAEGGSPVERNALLAGIYTLTTRMLIKLDDQQLGWMAADRARVLASGGGDPLAVGEAARNLAVLARKAGWHEQAASIALSAAASPLLAGKSPALTAERGLLIQSAAYTAARAGDRDGMRELTDKAGSLAARWRAKPSPWRPTRPPASSASGMKCNTATRSSAAGLVKSRKPPASRIMTAGSRRSARMIFVAPVPVGRALACACTTGS